MSDASQFPSVTKRFGLPLLYAGQAQKEFFVNEGRSLADALISCAVEGEANTPPATPGEGDLWLVGSLPTGGWSGEGGKLALYKAGSWRFIAPDRGLRVFDRSLGCLRLYHDSWGTPTAPAGISGGTVIDSEVRARVDDLIATLRANGMLAGG